MPSAAPLQRPQATDQLRGLGACIRARRRALGISARITAEAAGMSRVTLDRIERGEASVTMGAYANALAALGLQIEFATPVVDAPALAAPTVDTRAGIDAPVRIGDYPRLRALAWQLPDDTLLAPREALEIYERNWRHRGEAAWEPHERQLLDALVRVHGKGHLLV